MLRSSASINDGCTIIWDHQVAGKQFDKKLNRKTRSKACSQQNFATVDFPWESGQNLHNTFSDGGYVYKEKS